MGVNPAARRPCCRPLGLSAGRRRADCGTDCLQRCSRPADVNCVNVAPAVPRQRSSLQLSPWSAVSFRINYQIPGQCQNGSLCQTLSITAPTRAAHICRSGCSCLTCAVAVFRTNCRTGRCSDPVPAAACFRPVGVLARVSRSGCRVCVDSAGAWPRLACLRPAPWSIPAGSVAGMAYGGQRDGSHMKI